MPATRSGILRFRPGKTRLSVYLMEIGICRVRHRCASMGRPAGNRDLAIDRPIHCPPRPVEPEGRNPIGGYRPVEALRVPPYVVSPSDETDTGRAEREAVPPKGYGRFVTRYDRWNPLRGSTLRGSTPRLPGQLFRDTPASPAVSAASAVAVRALDASRTSASSTAQISPLPIQKSIDRDRNSFQGM